MNAFNQLKRVIFVAVAAMNGFAFSDVVTNVNVTGSETWTITDEIVFQGVANPSGTIDLQEGSVKLVGNSTGDFLLPESLRDAGTLAFWVDANTNVFADAENKVRFWADVRETFTETERAFSTDADLDTHAWQYVHAGNVTAVSTNRTQQLDLSTYPPLLAASGVEGRKIVDFGNIGGSNGQWLLLKDAEGNRKRVSFKAWFAVLAFPKTITVPGFVLGDIADIQKEGEGDICLHPGGIGGSLTEGKSTVGYGRIQNGAVRLNGKRINPRTTGYAKDGTFQRIGWNGPGIDTAFMSAFFNHSNYKPRSVGGGASNFYRQGGGQVGEFLLFSRVLTEDECKQVEAYLNAKWFGGVHAGAVKIASGLTATVGDAVDATVENVAGDGVLEKVGSGNLALGTKNGANNVSIRLEEGSVSFISKKDAPKLVLADGKTLTYSSDDALAVSEAAAGLATITKADDVERTPTVVLGGVDAAVKKIDVAGLNLAVCPLADELMTGLAETGVNYVANGSFEDPSITGFLQGSKIVVANWNNTSLAGIAANGSAFGNPSAPDGTQAGLLQSTKDVWTDLSQTVNVPIDGTYKLSFYVARRLNFDPPTLRVSVNDFVVYSNVVSNTSYTYREVSVPLKRGENMLKFSSYAVTSDRTAFLDKVCLEFVTEKECVYPSNPGFDRVEGITFGNSGGTIFAAQPVNAGWTFVGSNNQTAGISKNGGSFWTSNNPETAANDAIVCILQKTASMTNAIPFPRDGRVKLTFRYANRYSGGNRTTGHSCVMTLDGQELVTIYPTKTAMTHVAVYFDVTAGIRQFACQAVNLSDNGDRTTILDDFQFEYVDKERDVLPAIDVVDGAFHTAVAEGVAWVSSESAPADYNANENSIMLSSNTVLTTTMNIHSNGTYALKCQTRGITLKTTTENGPYNSASYYPHRFNVLVDGNRVASVATENPDKENLVIRLPYLTAGPHELSLVSDEDANASVPKAVTYLHDLKVVGLTVKDSAFDLSEVVFNLTDGAKLHLETEDRLVIKRVKVNGQSYSGLLTEDTCDFITGPGSLKCSLGGFRLIVR